MADSQQLTTVALTGGIASGKSTVAARLRELGFAVVDADRLGHAVYAPGRAALGRVVEAFGEGVRAADGSIDRRALGAIVFGSPDAMKRLTAIVWPEIRAMFLEETARLAAEGRRTVVVEAAVLAEAGWRGDFEHCWVVDVPLGVARERLMARNSLSAEEADKRIASQVSREERLALATEVLPNDRPLEETRAAVDAMVRRLGLEP